MQDRSYAIAILVILAICCLGTYVAVSGFLNSNPLLIASDSTRTPAVQVTQVVIAIPTDTPTLPKPGATPTLAPTLVPIPSPLGAFQTITAAVTVPRVTPTLTPRLPASPTPIPPLPSAQACVHPFCPRGGPPDGSLAPTGVDCPRNYIWGRIVDLNGRGIVGMTIRFRGPLGDMDVVATKGPPDPPGIYNILAPSGTFIIWVLDAGGGEASPRVSVTMQQPYTGTGNCPTRVDFVQQR